MNTRKFRVCGKRYGGELTIGIVSADFVRYWKDKDESDLINHITGLEWQDDDVDTESPYIFDDKDIVFNGCCEIDDILHIIGYYSDCNFFVSEITGKTDDWEYDENEKEFEPYILLGREYYSDVEEPIDPPDDSDYVPVLVWFSSEKGNFGTWFVETDGEDFDASKFDVSIIETNLAEIIDCAWYDKKELETNYDAADSMGKGYYAQVGWMNQKWIDHWENYSEEMLNDFWKEKT